MKDEKNEEFYENLVSAYNATNRWTIRSVGWSRCDAVVCGSSRNGVMYLQKHYNT